MIADNLIVFGLSVAHILKGKYKEEKKMNVNGTPSNSIMKIEDYPDLLDIQDVQQILRIGQSLSYKIIKAIALLST